jgi:hypothetical protein
LLVVIHDQHAGACNSRYYFLIQFLPTSVKWLHRYAQNNFLASMRRGSGDLELIDFSLNSSGWTRECSYGQRQGTDVTETALASFFGGAVTATRKADFLNVFLWQIEAVSQSVAHARSGAS